VRDSRGARGHHGHGRRGGTVGGGSLTGYGGRGGRGGQEGSKGGAPFKTSSGVAHREAPTPVGQRRSSVAVVSLPVTTLGCSTTMVVTSCSMLELRGGSEMAAQAEGNRAVVALTVEEEGGGAFA
jgi:hypothetical protein